METVIVSSSSAPAALKTDQTKCPFCAKVTYWSGRNKHIFSAKHLEEHVKPMLLKQDKYHLMAYRKASKERTCPLLYFGKDENRGLHLCFGCKKAKEYMPSYHLRECPHAEAHITALKALVGEPDIKEGDAEGEVDPDVVLKLKKEVESLKRQLKDQKNEVKFLEKSFCCEEYDGMGVEAFCQEIFNMTFIDMTEEKKKEVIADAKEGKIYRHNPNEGYR